MSRKLTAELFGTLWLVLGGCGSAVLAAKFPKVGIGLVGVTLAFGLTGGTSLPRKFPRIKVASYSKAHGSSSILPL